MANWVGVITNGGAALLAGWAQGGTLNIDSAAAGEGVVTQAALPSRTALVAQKQIMSIVSSSVIETGRRIKLQISAPTTGYTLNQIGIWASLDDGASTLLAIYQNEAGIPVPSSAESPEFVYSFYAILSISTEGELVLTIDPAAFVTTETFVEELAQKNMEIGLYLDTDGYICQQQIGGI